VPQKNIFKYAAFRIGEIRNAKYIKNRLLKKGICYIKRKYYSHYKGIAGNRVSMAEYTIEYESF
jgi:hypothetical protein